MLELYQAVDSVPSDPTNNLTKHISERPPRDEFPSNGFAYTLCALSVSHAAVTSTPNFTLTELLPHPNCLP